MLFNISLEFKKGSQAELISFSSTVHQSMSTDNQFVDYKPHIDVLKTKNDALTVAIANASSITFLSFANSPCLRM